MSEDRETNRVEAELRFYRNLDEMKFLLEEDNCDWAAEACTTLRDELCSDATVAWPEFAEGFLAVVGQSMIVDKYASFWLLARWTLSGRPADVEGFILRELDKADDCSTVLSYLQRKYKKARKRK